MAPNAMRKQQHKLSKMEAMKMCAPITSPKILILSKISNLWICKISSEEAHSTLKLITKKLTYKVLKILIGLTTNSINKITFLKKKGNQQETIIVASPHR